MLIKTVESYAVRVPLKPERRMISALGEHTVSRYVIVRLIADNGLEGVGEATVMPRWSGETVWGAKAVIDRLFAPLVVGCDPANITEIDRRMDEACKHNWFAKSAIEMACWDLVGKAAGKPVYELLGGPARPRRFRCRFSMGAYDLERARRTAADRVAAGFNTIKVKVGGRPEDDIARCRAVREVIGPDRELVIDANTGWDPDTAVMAINAMRDLNIALVEQPTPDGDYAGLARVRRETGRPVMADDICFNLAHARELLRNECCDVINVYPGKQGGIRKTREIVELAAKHGVACSIGSNLELDIGTAAMAHLVVGLPNMKVEAFPGDALGPAYHEFSVVKNPLTIDGPWVEAPALPGLGVEVDWQAVREHPCEE